jgi:hypothetical protein
MLTMLCSRRAALVCMCVGVAVTLLGADLLRMHAPGRYAVGWVGVLLAVVGGLRAAWLDGGRARP